MRNHWFLWYNLICMLYVIHHHMAAESSPVWVARIGTLVIPLFSMLAGFSWGGFLRKTKGAGAFYALKVFAYPYLFWALVYYAMNFIVLDVFIRHQSFAVPSLSDCGSMFLLGGCAVHLWFLPVLIYSSVITALLARFVPRRSVYLCVIGLLALISLMCSAIPNWGASGLSHFVKTYAFWFVPNFCLGILLSSMRTAWFKSTLAHRLMVVAFPLAVALLFCPRVHGTETLMTVILVCLALAYPQVVPAPKWLVATAPYVMGIYLVHALVVAVVTLGLRLVDVQALPNLIAWCVAAVILFVAQGLVWFQRKMPLVGQFV